MTKWLLALCLISAGCSKKKADEGAAASKATTTEKAKAPEQKAKPLLTAAWLGKTGAPPGELAKMKPGMSMAEAKKVSPLADKPGTQESELDDVAYAVQEEVTGGLDLMIRMPSAKKAVIEEAWGKGQDVDRGGRPVTVWFNPETGVRAAYSDEGSGKAYLRFEPYTPLAKLLGEGPQIAALGKPFEGRTKDELKALYPEYGGGGFFSLPATEWEFGSGGTTLSPYEKDGKVVSLAFSIPFKSPEAKAEIMKVIEAKWGKAKGKVDFMEGAFVYNKKDPHIELTEPGAYNQNAVLIRIGGK